MEPSKIGDWVRISVLGAGSFGMVSLWRCTQTNDSIAVKKCKWQCATSLTQKHKERWWKEVEIMKELDHQNIVKFKPLPTVLEEELDKFNPTKLPLLPMEYCQKGNLRHVLTQPSNMCGLEERVVRVVLEDISSAVCYLHLRNITHRDIKPENIVLQDSSTRPDGVLYKLIDLGYAKELNSGTVSFVGTLHYLAPEILANKNYDYSVDYWSLGVLTFELICGVLPFMPRLSPTERYNLIKEKAPDQLCLFKNHMGNIQYSSELFKENKISSCLKGHMETWLRKALQFNPKLRCEPFPNSNNFFDQLKHILAKKILKVFVVYQYKFYSYEFDESTRLSTVCSWVARDTAIPDDQHILLGNFQFGEEKETLVANCFIDENYELFLFKKDQLFNVERHSLPRLVKLMFDKPTEVFPWHEVKAIYSQSIHYIQENILLATSFAKATDQYLKLVNIKVNDSIEIWKRCKADIDNLLRKVKDSNTEIESGRVTVANRTAANRFLQFHLAVVKCVADETYLAVNMKKWSTKLRAMKAMRVQDDLIQLPQIKELLDKAIVCLQKTAMDADRDKEKLSCRDMLRIVNHTLKLRDKILTEMNLQVFARYLGKAIVNLKALKTWLEQFESHISSLKTTLDTMMVEDVTVTPQQNVGSDSKYKCAIAMTRVTNTDVLRSDILTERFSELISESIDNYRAIVDDIESYIKDNTSLL